MVKPIFTMLVGLPASGKSSWAEKNKNIVNAVIHSSDSIREQLGDVNDQTKNEEVFKILHARIKNDLKNGKDVIMDCTNISRKRRLHFINNELRDITCKKICVLFATPYECCLKNNENRERKVPKKVIERMIKNFEIPCKQEGWDDIKIVWWDWKKDDMVFDFHEDVEQWREISHDNPHHTLSIGDHMIKAYEYMYVNLGYNKGNVLLNIAAYMHDCGKPFTKAFVNSKGEPCETAHYYEHHNASSYLSLFYAKDLFEYDLMKLNDEEILCIALLIGLHMRPFLAWKDSDKSKEKDRKFFGNDIIHYVELIHKADLAAH